jgi:hypothetical protein
MFEPHLYLRFVNFLRLPFKECLIYILGYFFNYSCSVLFSLSIASGAEDASASAFRFLL